MDTPQQALDALQREVNLILEQTGRLFAAANSSSSEAALARASRLKQQLPVSNNRFHQALDVLDGELQFAKAVMRRDLAVARGNPAGLSSPQPSQEAGTTVNVAPSGDQDEAQSSAQKPTEAAQQQPEPKQESQPEAVDQPPTKPSPSVKNEDSTEGVDKKPTMAEEKPGTGEPEKSDAKLELDTKQTDKAGEEQAGDEKAPDTATFSNTGDLDSLFNDPASAGGIGGDNGDEPDFSTSADLNAEFDFGSFSAGLDTNNSNGNDNISALLPGLQDYANQNGGDADFNSLFNTDTSANPPDRSLNDGNQKNQNSQHDPTFDDFLDMTFDMGNDGNENQSGGNDFNFDFS